MIIILLSIIVIIIIFTLSINWYLNCTFTYCIYHGNSWIKKWTLFIKDRVAGNYFSPTTFFVFKSLKHNTFQSDSSNCYIYSFHTLFGKFHFPSIHRTSYHNQMPKQHHSHGFPLLSDLCSLNVWPFFQFLHFSSYRYFCSVRVRLKQLA